MKNHIFLSQILVLGILTLLLFSVVGPSQSSLKFIDETISEELQNNDTLSTSYMFSPGITRGPTVNLLYNTSVVIMWTTDTADASYVEYDTDTILDYTVSNSTPVINHRIELDGLTPNTKYYYRAGDGSTWSDIYEFTTAPSGDESFTFLYYGDHRPDSGTSPPPELAQLLDRMIEQHPNFVISGGDHIQDEAHLSWANYVAQTDRIQCNACYWVVLGNHDQPGTQVQAEWFEYPNEDKQHYYSFEYGNCLFIVLDAYHGRKTSPRTLMGPYDALGTDQIAWLEALLASATAKHRFILVHEPLYSKGEHVNEGLDADPEQRDMFWELLEASNVEAVLVSHDHLYYRIQVGNILQITSGAGGAPLVPPQEFNVCPIEVHQMVTHYVKVVVDGDEVRYTAYDIDDQIFDEFTTRSVVTDRPMVTSKTVSPNYPQPSAPFNIEATITNSTPLTSVTCYYRQFGSTTYTSASMSLVSGSGNTYSTEIGPISDQQRYYYYIEVNDTGGANYRSLLSTFAIDTISPTIGISNPEENSIVDGWINIEASSEDSLAIAYVELYLDEELLSDFTPIQGGVVGAPWEWDLGTEFISRYRWDTTNALDGQHNITVIAYDVGGNQASNSIIVYVRISPVPPISPLVLIGGGVTTIVICVVIVIIIIRRKRLSSS